MNPYASPRAADLIRPTASQVWLICEGDQANLGGWGWPWCRQKLFPDHLELKFLTKSFKLQVKDIRRLESVGTGVARELHIHHVDPRIGDTNLGGVVKIYPHHPARWYDAFEQLGIPTHDEADLRSSSQLSLRSSSWVSNIEGLFWFAVFAFAAIAAGISALLDLF